MSAELQQRPKECCLFRVIRFPELVPACSCKIWQVQRLNGGSFVWQGTAQAGAGMLPNASYCHPLQLRLRTSCAFDRGFI